MSDKTGIQVEGLASHSDVDPTTATQTQPGSTLPDQPGLQAPSPVHIETTRIPTAVGRRDAMELREYRGCDKLKDKVALVTGGDSGIGRSVAAMFALEGADVAIVYLPKEEEDAQSTKELVNKKTGRSCLLLPYDLSVEANCKTVVEKTIEEYGNIDILVNNAAVQDPGDLSDTSFDKLEQHFRINVFAQFILAKLCVPHMRPGSSIINTTSITAYQGKPTLLEYSSTKGAIVAFTRSLSKALIEQGIRVNAVAPGPVLTPLWYASFDKEMLESSLKAPTIGHLAHPCTFNVSCSSERPPVLLNLTAEIGPSYVFLASGESTQFTGQVLHPNGGTVVNG